MRHAVGVALVWISLSATTNALAQRSTRLGDKRKNFYGVNQSDYEDRTFHYGFFLALHSTRYNQQYSPQFLNPADTVVAITPRVTPGYGLGFIINYRFSKFFSVRALPAVSFYNRETEYQFYNPATDYAASNVQTRESTNVELSLLLKYQSVRRQNVRMYLVAGLKGGFEANTRQREGGDRLNTRTADLAVEYGAGFDLFYEFVKFSPELRFSHGFANVLVPDANAFSRGLTRLTTHQVSLYLHFE